MKPPLSAHQDLSGGRAQDIPEIPATSDHPSLVSGSADNARDTPLQLDEHEQTELLENSSIEGAFDQDAPRIDAAVQRVVGARDAAQPESVQIRLPRHVNAYDALGDAATPELAQWLRDLNQRFLGTAGNGVQRAHLHLSPGELGELDIQVSTQDSQVSVDVNATEHTAKEALADNLGRLRTLLDEAGLELIDARVGTAHERSGSQTSQDPQQQPRRAHTQNTERALPEGRSEALQLSPGSQLSIYA